jgi:general secretion pathway protein C
MRFDSSSIGSTIEKAFSIDGLVFLLGKLSLFAAVGFAHFMGVNLSSAGVDLGEMPTIESTDGGVSEDKHPLGDYELITSRNIFGEEESKLSTTITEPKASDAKLRLVATNVSTGAKSFAIIESEKKKEQDVFESGESIFGEAKLVKVLPDKVEITRNGKTEILELEELKGSSAGGVESLNDDETSFSVAESELEDALSNLPKLLSQARAVPYFRNGKSIGMRLFAIRKGSLYEKLGLKNGDIITSVNESSLSDPAQALKLFEKLKSEREIDVRLERNGENKSLDYSID